MVENGGRNPPLPPNVVTPRQLGEEAQAQAQAQPQNDLLDRSSTEEKPDNRPLLPPKYVSLRQLRERRLKEEQEKQNEKEKVKQSDNPARLPPTNVSLRQLREQRLKEEKEREIEKGKEKEKEIEKGKEREKETDNCASVPPNYVSLRQLQERRLKAEKEKENGIEEESENRPRLPPNYVSLRQLQEQRLKVEKKEDKVMEEMEEKGEKHSLLPPNYVSLRQLRELRLREKEEKQAEEEVPKARIQQTKVHKKGDESGQIEVEINKKACNLSRNLQSNYKHGCAKSSWVWEPVHQPAGTGSSAGASSADSVFLPENAGVSHEVAMASSDQIEDAEMKLKNKNKKKKEKKKQQQQSWKKTSGKDNGELVQGPELIMEVTDLEIRKAVNASSSATKEVTLNQNEKNRVKKGKGGKVNLTESSTIPILVQKKRFNGAQSKGFKMHNSRDKGKGKDINLLKQNHNVVPLSEVAEGLDGVEEVIGSKIDNGEQKGKGKMINIPELIDQTPCREEAKGVLGAGEVIGSEIWNGKEEKGRGKDVNLPESSKWGGQIGGCWRKRNKAAGIRGKGHPRAGEFPARPAEHLRGRGGLVWVPKKSS